MTMPSQMAQIRQITLISKNRPVQDVYRSKLPMWQRKIVTESCNGLHRRVNYQGRTRLDQDIRRGK